MNLPQWLRRQTPDERIAADLADAKMSRLSAALHVEYYIAMLALAETRIKRLEAEDNPKVDHMIGVKK